jgi:predicted RND superfamily exporter protein
MKSAFAKSLRSLRGSLLMLSRGAARRSRVTLVLFSLLIGVSATGFPKLRTLLAMEDLLGSEYPSKVNLESLNSEFKIRNSMRAIIPKPDGGWTRDDLILLDRWLKNEKMTNRSLISTASIFDLRDTHYTGTHLGYPRIVHVEAGADPKTVAVELGTLAASPWEHLLIGPDASYLSLNLELTAAEDAKYGSFDPKAVSKIQEGFKVEITDKKGRLKPFWVGAADFQNHFYVGLRRVSVLNVILLFMMVGLLRLGLGTWKSGMIFVTTLIVTGVILYGLMGLAGAPVDILSKSLFLMTAVAALEDFYFLSALQLRTKFDAEDRQWRKRFREMIGPSFLTSLTTALGFGSLCTSKLEVISRFGKWAAIGAVIEWAVLFLAVPAAAEWIRLLRFWVDAERVGVQFLSRLENLTPSRHAFKIVGLVIVATFFSFSHLNVQDEPEDLFPASHPLRQGLNFLRETSGWDNEASLIFPPGVSREASEAIVAEISKNPTIARTKSPFAFLDFFARDVKEPAALELIDREIRGSRMMENYFGTTSEFRYSLLLRKSDTQNLLDLDREVEKACANVGCRIAGASIVYAEFSSLVPTTLIESLGVSLVLVSLVLLWLTIAVGKVSVFPTVLLSSFWGTALMFVVMASFQIHVNFLTCIFASVLVGLTGDNAILFLLGSRRAHLSHGIGKFGNATIKCALTMIIASLVFLGSYFVPPRVFGVLLAGGFLASLIGDYWLLKGLVLNRESKP